MASVGTAVDKTGVKKPFAPPNRKPGKRSAKSNEGTSNKESTAAAMQVEDPANLLPVDDASMGGLTQPTQDDAEMAFSTQGSTSTAASNGLPTMGDEMKWSVVLNVAEKVKLGLEKNVFAANMVEDVVESMVKNMTGKQSRFIVLERERTCMTTSAIMLVKTLEMEEASRTYLKVGEDNSDEKNSVAVLEGKVAEFRFIVQQRMQGNATWRSAIHEQCKEKWELDRRNVLEASDPDTEVKLDVIDIATVMFRTARRQRPKGGSGLLDTDELHEHIRKYTDKLINECKDSEVLTDLHWKPVARRLLEYVLAAEDAIVDARICFGSLLQVDLEGVDLSAPKYKNRTDALDGVKKRESRRRFNYLMIGDLELGFAESSWRRVCHEVSEDDTRDGMPDRGGHDVDEETAAVVTAGFWEVDSTADTKSTALAVRGSSSAGGSGSTALALRGKGGKRSLTLDDLERWHKMTAIEKLQECRETPLDEILMPSTAPGKEGYFVLMKGYFILEVEEVAKTVAIFRMCEVLDLSDDLAIRVRGQRGNRITGLIRKIPFALEKGDFVASLVDWQNHYKSGKAELRITSEDHTFIVRDAWKFIPHAETKGVPEKIPDIKIEPTGAELVKFDEKSIFAKVQSMIDENSRTLRKEIEDGNKENIKKMEDMPSSSINPLQEKMASVVKSNEDAKNEPQHISQRMKKTEEKTKKTIKKGQKRSDRMLAALMTAMKLEAPPDEDEPESSADSDDGKQEAGKQSGVTGSAPEIKAENKKLVGDGANGNGAAEQRMMYGEGGELIVRPQLVAEKPSNDFGEEKNIKNPGAEAGDAGAGSEVDEKGTGTGAPLISDPDAEGKAKGEVARIEEQATLKRASIGPSAKAASEVTAGGAAHR